MGIETDDIWFDRLDKLRQKLNFKSDAKLADYLGISRSFLSQIRKKERPFTIELKFKILDHLGYFFTIETIIDIFPENVKVMLLEKIVLQGEHNAQDNAPDNN